MISSVLTNTPVDIYRVKNFRLTMAPSSQTRGNGTKICTTFTRKPRSSIVLFVVVERVVADWNTLPHDVVTATSVSRLKTRVDALWKNLQSIFELVSL